MSMKVECPRCHKILTARRGDESVECNCHRYCSEGSKPQDCTLIAVGWTGRTAWPRGMPVNPDPELEPDHYSHNYYCTLHGKYSDKRAILVEVDWSKQDRRATSKLRDFGSGTP
jgi:hypothetical protein